MGKLHACASIAVWLLFRHVAQALNSVEKDLKISSWQKGLPVATQRIHYSMIEPTFDDKKCLHEVMKTAEQIVHQSSARRRPLVDGSNIITVHSLQIRCKCLIYLLKQRIE